MSTTTSERRLVDMEFKPDELPAADLTPLSPPTQEVPRRPRRTISLATRLATGAVAALLGLYVIDAAIALAKRAAAGDLLDAAYLVALLVLVGSLIRVGVQQTRALRKLKSAEQARALAA